MLIPSGSVYAYGTLSLANSVLYNSDASVSYHFSGFESGCNTTILCGDGYTCSIYYIAGGCKRLIINCVDECMINLYCIYAEFDENYCPGGYRILADINIDIIKMPSLVNTTMSTLENSDNSLCNGSYYCGDYKDSKCINENLISLQSPICCDGSYACTNATIDIDIDIDMNETPFVFGVRCDGSSSCYGTTSIRSSGDVYMTGYDNYGLNVIETINSDSESYSYSYNSSIFCTGYLSCQYHFIRNAYNLYCTGSESCIFSQLISNIINVFGCGYKFNEGASFESIENIYCGCFHSCYNTTINYVSDNVYANNYQALYNSSISHINNNLIGLGFQVMKFSTIYNVSNVYCTEYESCSNTYIRGIHNMIQVNGKAH